MNAMAYDQAKSMEKANRQNRRDVMGDVNRAVDVAISETALVIDSGIACGEHLAGQTVKPET